MCTLALNHTATELSGWTSRSRMLFLHFTYLSTLWYTTRCRLRHFYEFVPFSIFARSTVDNLSVYWSVSDVWVVTVQGDFCKIGIFNASMFFVTRRRRGHEFVLAGWGGHSWSPAFRSLFCSPSSISFPTSPPPQKKNPGRTNTMLAIGWRTVSEMTYDVLNLTHSCTRTNAFLWILGSQNASHGNVFCRLCAVQIWLLGVF